MTAFVPSARDWERKAVPTTSAVSHRDPGGLYRRSGMPFFGRPRELFQHQRVCA
jgi:hypothetical protein